MYRLAIIHMYGVELNKIILKPCFCNVIFQLHVTYLFQCEASGWFTRSFWFILTNPESPQFPTYSIWDSPLPRSQLYLLFLAPCLYSHCPLPGTPLLYCSNHVHLQNPSQVPFTSEACPHRACPQWSLPSWHRVALIVIARYTNNHIPFWTLLGTILRANLASR